MQNHCIIVFNLFRFSSVWTYLGLGCWSIRLWDLEVLVLETCVTCDLLKEVISGLLILLKCWFLDFEILIFVKIGFFCFFWGFWHMDIKTFCLLLTYVSSEFTTLKLTHLTNTYRYRFFLGQIHNGRPHIKQDSI